MAKMYSVYRMKGDLPVVIYASAKECAKTMGITINAFYKYIWRMRAGKCKQRKWMVCEEEKDDIVEGCYG